MLLTLIMFLSLLPTAPLYNSPLRLNKNQWKEIAITLLALVAIFFILEICVPMVMANFFDGIRKFFLGY
ncbi:MAG: hypothetical protein ACTSQI_07675 [Candidatus Helarchaeota archaeon]